MMSSCDRCGNRPVVFIRYSGQHLCSEHFLDLLNRRFKKELRSQKTIRKNRRIGVAVSGGKDSLLCLILLNDVIKDYRDVELTAITIDEGIDGYRPSSLDIIRQVAGERDIPLTISSYKDLYGFELDDILKKTDVGPCSVCGILRRNALNRAASREECGVLVTGHNLDDMAQTVLMNVMQADVSRLARLGPHLEPIPGLIPRSIPLRTTPENEAYLAALLMDLPLHDVECPYSISAKRGHFRDLVLKAEEETPGSRHSLLRFQEQVSPLIPRENSGISPCIECGEPVIDPGDVAICKACSFLRDIGVM